VLAPGIRVLEACDDTALVLPLTRQTERPSRGTLQVSGGDIEEATPDPIPNSEVKLFGADGTARAT
jgi:hypothetical protein